MYDNETKDRFVELRAEGLSFDKIAAQLGTSKSTLHRWADEREADIARLRRLQWEEMENEFGWRFEHQLLELNSSIDAYEEHLRRIPVSQLNVRETVMLLRESRRQRDRLRALLMGTGTPSIKSNKTERFPENATTQPRNTSDLQQSNFQSFDSVIPELRAEPRCETESNPRGLTSQETIDNTTTQPANAAQAQSQIENPKSEIDESFILPSSSIPTNVPQPSSSKQSNRRTPIVPANSPAPNQDSTRHSAVLWCGRIQLVFRDRRVHLVPRLRVRNEEVHLRTKPAWVVQAGRSHSDKTARAFIGFSASQSRSAVAAEAALVFAARQARREMITKLPLRQPKRRSRHQQAGDESAASHSLAVATMTLERHDRLSRAFITNRSAHAPAGKWNIHAAMLSKTCDPINRSLVSEGVSAILTFRMSPRLLVVFALTAGFCARIAAVEPLSSVPLKIPAQGKTGFTLLKPEQTGLAFTNSIDELKAAANRTLYNGSGVAVGDFDADGLPDIFFCSLNGGNTLYKNLGAWRFADVTESAGLKRDDRIYRGAVFTDVNGDALLDLLVCVQGEGVQCLLNSGNGRFIDATTAARTASKFAATTLALADVDGNGTLDLYVANNRTEDIRDRGKVDLQSVNGRLVVPPALRDRLLVTNGVVQEYGEPDQLYLNNGKGQFAPMSWTGGRFRDEQGRPLAEAPKDWALTATFRDINNDGAPDLYVCNDFWTPDRFWINDGKGRFRAMSLLAWRNMSASSMGLDFADIDRDGDLDFFVVDMLSRDPRVRKRQKLAQPSMASGISEIETRPQFMRNTLFVNRGDGTYAEIANFARVAASEWAWSPVFLDVDLDGYEDLLITSGHAKDVQDLDAAAMIRARQHSWKGFTNEVERQNAFTQELMEHMRLYPRLDTPIVAFRNRGDLRFDDVTGAWGTDQPAVHHAIATADFDGDGDLDFVVNNLGSAAGLYRNDSAAPRVAVRLRGLAANTQAIGARVKLLGGAVPLQSQEVVSGGRYLAGSDPLLTFAAGTARAMRLEVTWRNGEVTTVSNVEPNQTYTIAQAVGARPSRAETQTNAPLFKDVSHLLRHTHVEQPFNDFERQPLLPRRLSQSGPGVCWLDIDGDGHDDLLIGSGRGGRLAYFRNKGNGEFERVTQAAIDSIAAADQTGIVGWRAGEATLLIGSDGFENPAASGIRQLKLSSNSVAPLSATSAGPLALADLDGDGDLDLFAGGRAIPGRYPEAAPSHIFRFDNDRFVAETNGSIGIVNGAVWSDLTGDGFPELIVASEWGPIRIFKNERGQLTEWQTTLTGWWNGVTTGDIDGDGRLDIVAANWGLNSEYTATRERPLELHYRDLLDRGVVDLIETEWDGNAIAPRRRLDVLGRELPPLQEHFTSHRKFSEAALSDVIKAFPTKPKKLQVTTLASMVFLNRGDRFEAVELPTEAQWAPAFGVNVADFDGDGNQDVFLSQNFFATEPETPRLDAGRGLLLRGLGGGRLEAVNTGSGIEVYGEQRGSAVCDFDKDGRLDLVVAQSGAATKLFQNVGAKPGLRVRLQGPSGNPQGIGATVRLKFGDKLGPAQEVHAGSGYWSQDSSVLVLTAPEKPSAVVVRWPGGSEASTPVGDERELTIAK